MKAGGLKNDVSRNPLAVRCGEEARAVGSVKGGTSVQARPDQVVLCTLRVEGGLRSLIALAHASVATSIGWTPKSARVSVGVSVQGATGLCTAGCFRALPSFMACVVQVVNAGQRARALAVGGLKSVGLRDSIS